MIHEKSQNIISRYRITGYLTDDVRTCMGCLGEYSISITNDKTGHTYEAYQIFTGDLNEGVLSNVQWGSGVNGTTLLAALKLADEEKYGACETAADVSLALGTEGASAADAEAFAEVAAQYLTSPAGSANAPVEGKYTISGLDAGYYLVKDKDGSLTGQMTATRVISYKCWTM